MKIAPLFGGGIAGKSLPLTAQRRLNVYAEQRPDGDKTKVAFIGTPGLVYQFALPNVVRGLLGTQNNLYAVAGSTFYSLTSTGSVVFSDTINSYQGNVSMASSPNQVLIVDGQNGWIYKDGGLIDLSNSSVTTPTLTAINNTLTNIPTLTCDGTGSIVTITFAAQVYAPIVGSTVTIAGVFPAGYNGSFTVTASSTTFVSFANATTGSQVVSGTVSYTPTNTVTFLTQTSVPYVGSFVTIAGVTPATFNGTFTVLSATTSSVTFANSASGQQTVAGTISLPSTSGGFPIGCRTCTFVGGYFIAEQPGTQQFYVSNSYDGTTWNALAFASASQYPDTLQAVDYLTGNLILFSQLHIEFWQNVGSVPEPFAPILAATTEYGLAAIWSRAHLANSIFFLAQNPQGAVQVAVVHGYQVEVVSTPDLDYIMSQFTNVSDAVAMGYQVDNHAMYQLTFPTDNRTFLFDMSSGIWSEMQTGVTSGYAQRHIGNFCEQFAGQTYVTDYSNGNLYNFSQSAYTDNGTPILRQLTTRHGSTNFNTFAIDELYFDMETGVGLETGQGSDPQIMIACSKDNGRTYSTDRFVSLGAVGQYLTRVITRQWGSARDFVFRIQMTDPVKFVLNDGAVTMREKPQ